MHAVPDRQFLAAPAEIEAVAVGPGGRHRGHLVRRKLALRQDVQHFAPDIAGRSDHNYAVTQVSILLECANGRRFLPDARPSETLSFRRDRQRVVSGKRVLVRVNIGGHRYHIKHTITSPNSYSK